MRRLPSAGPLRRARHERLVGGVAAGLAERRGWDVTVVRCVFVLAALASGFGAAAYVLAWLLLPMAGESASIASKAMTDRRGIALAGALVSLLFVALLIVPALRASWLDAAGHPADRHGGRRRADLAKRLRRRAADDPALRRAADRPGRGPVSSASRCAW